MTKHKGKIQNRPQVAVRVAARRARLMKLFAEGKSTRKAAKILQSEGFPAASKAIVARDLQAMSREAPACVEEARAEAEHELKALKKFIAESDMSDSETVHGLLAIHDRIARLLGLDAPTKSIGVKVNADADPATMGLYARFLHETRHLNAEQTEQVFQYARSLKADSGPVILPPESSPLWEEEQ